MNRLRSPIVVTPPPPAVPRWMVTNSRKMLPAPISSRVGFAAGISVLRREADRGVREDLVAVADRGVPVDHRRRADLAVAADAHVRANHRERANGGALANRPRSARRAPADRCGRSASRASSSSASTTVWPSTSAMRARLHQRTASGAERDDQLQLIAGNDVLAELGAVDAAQLHADAPMAAGVDRAAAAPRPASAPQSSGPPASAACAENVPGKSLR